MSSRPSLSARLAQAAEPAPVATPAPSKPAPKPAAARAPRAALAPETSEPIRPKARVGKTMIAGYFSAEMARAVKMLAVERGVTVQALIGEGLDHLLRQAGKHPMGER